MKTLLNIFAVVLVTLMFNCAHTDVQESLNIRADEILELEPLYAYPITPWHMQVMSECRGVPVVFVLYTEEMIIVRYCYLDQGKLVAFAIDAELYVETGEEKYVRADVPDDMVDYIRNMLERMEQGLPPIDDSEFGDSVMDEV